MDINMVLNNSSTIFQKELIRAKKGDESRQKLFGYSFLMSENDKIFNSFPYILSSRAKDEASYKMFYASNKSKLIALDFLATLIEKYQLILNRTDGRREQNNFDQQFLYAQNEIAKAYDEISKILEGKRLCDIESNVVITEKYSEEFEAVNDFKRLEKLLQTLTDEEKAQLMRYYAADGEMFGVISEAELFSEKDESSFS